MKATILLILISMLSLTNCDKKDKQKEPNEITANATIGLIKLDSCYINIMLDNKYVFTSDNLPKEFQKDNLRVKITYVLTNERVPCGFSGSLLKINIIKIEKII